MAKVQDTCYHMIMMQESKACEEMIRETRYGEETANGSMIPRAINRGELCMLAKVT